MDCIRLQRIAKNRRMATWKMDAYSSTLSKSEKNAIAESIDHRNTPHKIKPKLPIKLNTFVAIANGTYHMQYEWMTLNQ